MGNSQASNLRAQFETVELRESTKKQLWQVYHCTPKASSGPSSSPAKSEKGEGGNDDGSESPLSSPRRVDNSAQPVAAGASPIDGGAAAGATTVVMLQLNTQHAAFKAACVPPRALNPDQHVPSQYKLQYNMLDASYRALQWLRDHPHRSLLRVRSVECHTDSKVLFATTPYTSIEPIVLRLPVMCATEILFGLVKVAEALAQLHSSGLAHRYVTWKSVYLAYTALSAASSVRAEAVWTLGEPQFLSSSVSAQEHNQDALKDYLSEVRGARQDPSLLPYFAPEMNNPYAASQWDWSKMPIGAGDVFSFGVMVDMVLNTDRTRFQTTSSSYYNPVPSGGCSAKVALDELKLFAKSCQHDDPFKRPPIEAFMDLVAVNYCTYVMVQQQLDHYRGSGLVQKVHFFYLLHAEMLKLPYDQLVTRVMPRLLKSSIWSEPCAEPFIRQLLVPLHGGAKAVGSVVTAASDVPPEDILVLPLSDEVRELLSLPPGDEWHLTPAANNPSKPGGGLSTPPPEPLSKAPTTARVPQLPCVGLLQLTDYQALVGAFIKKTMERIVLQSKSPRPSPLPELAAVADRIVPVSATPTSPQLLCVLLRNVDSYVSAVSFVSVVIPCVIPFVSHCLRHEDADVVMEALRAFNVLHRFVMHAYERLHAPVHRQNAASQEEGSTDVPHIVGAPPTAAADNATLVSAAVANARTLLLGVLARDIFSLACTDLVADIRLAALTTSIRSLSNPASSWKWMPRDRAITALCCNIMIVRADGAGGGGPLHIPDTKTSIAFTTTSIPLIQISMRAMKFVEKILPWLAPSEVVQGIVPSVVNVCDRCNVTVLRTGGAQAVPPDNNSRSDSGTTSSKWKQLNDLSGCAVRLLTRLFEHLHGAEVRSPDGPSVGGAVQEGGVSPGEEDEVDAVEALSSTASSSQNAVGRSAVLVDVDGWCEVRDPSPFESVFVKKYIATMPYRPLASSSRQRVGAPSTRVGDNIPASMDGAGGPSHGVETGDEVAPQLGKWSGLTLPVDMIRALPLYSFVDCDHEFNTAAIVKPDLVAAEIISAASTTRTFVASIKPHVLASRLPSRRPASLAPATDDGQQLLAPASAKRAGNRPGRGATQPLSGEAPRAAVAKGKSSGAAAAVRRSTPMALDDFESTLGDAQQAQTVAPEDIERCPSSDPIAQGPLSATTVEVDDEPPAAAREPSVSSVVPSTVPEVAEVPTSGAMEHQPDASRQPAEDGDDYRAPSSDATTASASAEIPSVVATPSMTDSFGSVAQLSGSRQRSGGGSFKGQKPANQPVPRRKKGVVPQLSTSPNAVPKLLNDDDL